MPYIRTLSITPRLRRLLPPLRGPPPSRMEASLCRRFWQQKWGLEEIFEEDAGEECIAPTGVGESEFIHKVCALYPYLINNSSLAQAPSTTSWSPADCQASATPKNASKGESQPKHFFGLKLIDKTIFCKVSLSKE